MDRRKAIKHTTLLLGTALSGGTMAGLMAGCKAEIKLGWEPSFFNSKEAQTLESLVDTILPKTETPAASEVGVPAYIDDIIGHFWKAEDQKQFQNDLTKVNKRAHNLFGAPYAELSTAEQNKIMDHLVEKARSAGTENQPFFLQLKELTYSGYFTSEFIGEEVLAYDPVPGTYIGDLPIEDVDQAWSL
ncbi:gluconate 2-dehydrogenase subunit 3 family protein [Membranicola marinus]|uniref:Gluconate 2-dehydrogenase subunit 3 family protein n=1 Tax=Membranihabitans marinus TaxID=1227546 RepID=A0A953HL97_9BACT|nr:gluconate 2-dehydrogenase subunit 3 family protein [Membranihabitans marinus]MBY5957154.1 gluconate 2-dehydrogenase subunit 3 family protein [Membranihabitans marinus]